jgi:Tol biopolymer transport system component
MNTKIFYIVFALLFLWCSNLESQYFGKNKKQYAVYDWKYIESEHFDVYYNDGSRVLGEFAIVALENALLSIQTTLNYQITARIPVVVYESHNDFQQTNVINMYLSQGIGGVTEMYKNRIVIPFQGSYSQLRHVLHHELVHAVINDMFYGGKFQTAVNTGAVQIPLWINEGFAEYESLGGMDAETDMYMRDLTISESLPSLKMISGYNAYRVGQTFFYFIEKQYGKGKITEFLNKLKLFKSLEVAFRNSFGMGIEDFSEFWQTEIKKWYYPDIAIYKAPKEFASVLTNHDKDNCYYYSSPAISPNGEKMAFISDRDGGIFSVFTSKVANYNEKTFAPKRLVSSARQLDFEQLNILTPSISWTPDNKKVVISAKSGGEDAIFIIDEDSKEYEKVLLGMKSITSVNCSPDGKYIAFIGVKSFQSDIYTYNIKTKKMAQITNDAYSDFYPIWSKDSKSIFFISDREDDLTTTNSADKIEIWKHNYNSSDVYNIDIASKTINRITHTPNINKTCIAVSPDTKKILIVADENGISNIYEMNIAGGTNISNNSIMKPLTNSANAIKQISVTADGYNLIFASQVKGGYDIFELKNIFDKSPVDTLPLTNYVKEKLKLNTITESNSMDTLNKKIEAISYGKFKTDFTHQQFIKANNDVISQQQQEVRKVVLDVRNSMENDYAINFSLDAFIVNPAVSTFYGVQGNMAALFSDILGNHQIYLSAYFLSSLENSQFYGAYSYNTHLIDYTFSFYNKSIYTWNFLEDFGNYYPYSYRATGAILGASYPFSLFDRVELNLNLVNAAKHNSDMPSYESINRFLVVPELQYVLDNSLNGIYAPTRGTRMYVKAMYSPKLGNISPEFITLVADARHYFEFIPNFMSLAVRSSLGISAGANPQKFYLGGVENWLNALYKAGDFELDEPEDFAFLNSWVMPLRGWAVFHSNANNFALANIEYRFPLLLAFGTGGLPLVVQGIMGNVFCDLGASFPTNNKLSSMKYGEDIFLSSGFGIRAILIGLPIKFDIAWRRNNSGWSSPNYLFSIGLDF